MDTVLVCRRLDRTLLWWEKRAPISRRPIWQIPKCCQCTNDLELFKISNVISNTQFNIRGGMSYNDYKCTMIYLDLFENQHIERYPFDHQLSHINVTVKSITTWKTLNWSCLGKIIYFIDIILIRLNGF